MDPSASSLVTSVRYRIAIDRQAQIARQFAPVVFKELAVTDGTVEVIASVPASLKGRFLADLAHLGGIIQNPPAPR